MTRSRAVIAVATFGAVLVVAGLLLGTPTPTVEGAYFDRANGVPTSASVFAASKPTLFDPADGNLWIGAGLVLLLLAAATVVYPRLRHRSALPS